MITITCKNTVTEQLLANDLMKHKGIEVKLAEAKETTNYHSKRPEYTDSGEFTDEYSDVARMIKDIKNVITSARWKAWMKVTDANYSTECERFSQDVNKTFKDFAEDFSKLEDCIDNAGEDKE